MTKLSDLTEVFGVYSYKSPLIRARAEDHKNWKHREFTVKKDFLAKAYITKLDEEIWAEKPITTPNIFSEQDTNAMPETIEATEPVVDTIVPSTFDVSPDWELEKWDSLGKKMFDSGRTHSFCVVQLYDDPPYWKVFTWREIEKIEYDKKDNPIGCKVVWEKKLVGADKWRRHVENLKFYRPEKDNNDNTALLVPFGIPTGDDLGEYDLEDKWDLMMYIRYCLLDIANNSAKTSGFYHYKWASGTKPEAIENVLDAVDVVGSNSGIGASEDALREIKPIFPAKPEFTILALEMDLLLFAGGCRLPLRFFRSEKDKGAGFGGIGEYVDEGLVTKKKKYIFSEFTSAIKTLVKMRWGIILEDVKPFIQAEFDAIELDVENKSQNQDNQNNDKKESDK